MINQKLRLRSASAAVQDRSISRAAAGSAPTACVSPSGCRPIASGARRMSSATGGTAATSTIRPSHPNAPRQPWRAISHSVSGTKITPPIEIPAVAIPSACPAPAHEPTGHGGVAGQTAERRRAERHHDAHHQVELRQRRDAVQQPEADGHRHGADELRRARAAAVDDPPDRWRVEGAAQ